ncbi:procathepsin L-like [Drosophila sulfurigaster albostrigata]|uniref:procathepsin L-like n=1 Tax=Drosophila sulfurigaster albostrigata TaxID=89887 RepID=UPI002D218ECB|nr:procathepsin L-like [Drosophila sulfurigaster albostrigata]
MKAAICILLFALVGYIQARITYDDVLDAEFELFKVEHKRSYDNEYEEQLRLQIFKDNKNLIDRHNKRYAAGEKTYKMGVNKFTDLTPEEFKISLLSSLNSNHSLEGIDYIYNPSAKDSVPKSIDWRTSGAVNPIKDQNPCGSCWAFSAVGSLESQYFINEGRKISLSEQNLVDCSRGYPYYNRGCSGGWPIEAFQYIRYYGIDTESSYPYEARDDYCRYNRNYIGAKISGIVQIESGNEDALASAVANKGPISVCFTADSNFQHYRSGVFNDPSCSQPMNHCVVVIGYGTDPVGEDYWLVRNSWGENWGENGYIRMARNRNNQCSIASFATYPLI